MGNVPVIGRMDVQGIVNLPNHVYIKVLAGFMYFLQSGFSQCLAGIVMPGINRWKR
jgi:hypothetical protein